MNILVLNGSPKGNNSITLQTVLYLQKKYSSHSCEVLNVGLRIKALEKDFAPAAAAVEKADLLLFAYPVYTFVAPCQLHRFIELLKGSGINLQGKFATQISTSKHFYDITAHRYIQDNCQDMGLKYIRGLSADMEDLLCQQGRKEAREFFEYVCHSVENNSYETLPQPLPRARPDLVFCSPLGLTAHVSPSGPPDSRRPLCQGSWAWPPWRPACPVHLPWLEPSPCLLLPWDPRPRGILWFPLRLRRQQLDSGFFNFLRPVPSSRAASTPGRKQAVNE